jgi:hypothetical protein
MGSCQVAQAREDFLFILLVDQRMGECHLDILEIIIYNFIDQPTNQ